MMSNNLATFIFRRRFEEKLHQLLSVNSSFIRHQHLPAPKSTPPEYMMFSHFSHRTSYSKLNSRLNGFCCSTRNFEFIARKFHLFHNQHERYCHSWSVHIENETVSGAVNRLKEKFAREDIPESDVVAEFIVAHALGVKQLSDFARTDQLRILSAEEVARVTELANQKLARIPLQYIIGEWDFRDLTLKMKPPVFIPRPETEMLVDLLVSHYAENEELQILEVGCGSGAIGLSLLHEFEKAHVTAIDASSDAVKLTQENATRLGLSHRLTIHHTALKEGSPLAVQPKKGSRYDVIVSNPPYLFSRDMDDLDPEISRNEDSIALEGGAEGLDVIKAIIKHTTHLLKPHGLIWLETDTRHPEMIQDMLAAHPETSVRFNRSFLDFTDRTRFCQLEHVP